MAVAAHKMAAGPRKEGTLNTCFVRVVDARPRKTMTPQQGFCSNMCVNNDISLTEQQAKSLSLKQKLNRFK